MLAWTCLVSVTSLHRAYLWERFLPEGLRMSLSEFFFTSLTFMTHIGALSGITRWKHDLYPLPGPYHVQSP